MKLSELKKLCDEATPGPWKSYTEPFKEMHEAVSAFDQAHARGVGPETSYVWLPDPDGGCDIFTALTGNGPRSPKNAAFIAAARTMLPKLIAVAEASHNVCYKWFNPTFIDTDPEMVKLKETLKELEEK